MLMNLSWDCWGTVWNPCPPFGGRANVLVYAIINGEKVYSIEESEEYLDYIRTYDVKTATQSQQIELHQNYPNPFNPTTKIEYSLPEASMVKLTVYNSLGQEVASLVNEYKAAGKHIVDFNANNLPSGMYFYKLQSGNFNSVKKMMLIK